MIYRYIIQIYIRPWQPPIVFSCWRMQGWRQPKNSKGPGFFSRTLNTMKILNFKGPSRKLKGPSIFSQNIFKKLAHVFINFVKISISDFQCIIKLTSCSVDWVVQNCKILIPIYLANLSQFRDVFLSPSFMYMIFIPFL